jgi:excisionase family DNA binding protein
MANVMTVKEVAEFLRAHPSTIYRLLKRHGLPAFKVGSDWRFDPESIQRWLKESESKPAAI